MVVDTPTETVPPTVREAWQATAQVATLTDHVSALQEQLRAAHLTQQLQPLPKHELHPPPFGKVLLCLELVGIVTEAQQVTLVDIEYSNLLKDVVERLHHSVPHLSLSVALMSARKVDERMERRVLSNARGSEQASTGKADARACRSTWLECVTSSTRWLGKLW